MLGFTISARCIRRAVLGVVPALAVLGAVVLTLLPMEGLPAAAASSTSTRAALAPGRIQHIFVIDLENENAQSTFGSGSPAPFLTQTLASEGEVLANYYGIGHASLDNYIAQVSGQSPTTNTQADCLPDNAAFVNVVPGTPDRGRDQKGQVVGQGCVYPKGVPTIASQLDTMYPPNPHTHVAAWRAYEEDMGNTPSRDGGAADPSGGTDCAHPAIGAPDTAEFATAADQYTTRHNPFMWFHSAIDGTAECNANVVPLGTLEPDGSPSATGHLARDLQTSATTPRFGFITPNLCDDGHDATCAGRNSAGGTTGGLAGADVFLRHWMPLILDSPAYRSGNTLVVITFDEAELDPSTHPDYAAACCSEPTGPNTKAPGNAGATSDTAPGGGRVGAVLLNPRYISAGTVDTVPYNHYSALRSYEDLLGLTTGGVDGHGHLGFAGAAGLKPFGRDVFNKQNS